MRRQNPVSVKVKAPSRGLITRFPGETADNLGTGAEKFSLAGPQNRASAVGSNVRYEDGVVRAAPGYDRVNLVASILVDLVAHWRLNEYSGTRFEATLNHYDLAETIGAGETVGVLQASGKFETAALFNDPVSEGASIRVDGNATIVDPLDRLLFGFIDFEESFFIFNTGSVPLIVTNVATVSANFTPDWTSGTIGVGLSQEVVLTQAAGPPIEGETTTLTVTSNAVSGRDTISVTGTATES